MSFYRKYRIGCQFGRERKINTSKRKCKLLKKLRGCWAQFGHVGHEGLFLCVQVKLLLLKELTRVGHLGHQEYKAYTRGGVKLYVFYNISSDTPRNGCVFCRPMCPNPVTYCNIRGYVGHIATPLCVQLRPMRPNNTKKFDFKLFSHNTRRNTSVQIK